MARIRRLHRIHRKRSDRVDGELVNGAGLRLCGHSFEPLWFRRHDLETACQLAGETFCTAHKLSCVANNALAVKRKFIPAHVPEQNWTRRVVAALRTNLSAVAEGGEQKWPIE
jgi:hypothetical protein